MDFDQDRQRARRRLRELQDLLANGANEASPDAKLEAYAAVVSAEAMLLHADVLRQSIEKLQFNVIPRIEKTFRPR